MRVQRYASWLGFFLFFFPFMRCSSWLLAAALIGGRWTRPMDELVGGDQTLVYKPVRYEEYPSEQIRSSTDEAAWFLFTYRGIQCCSRGRIQLLHPFSTVMKLSGCWKNNTCKKRIKQQQNCKFWYSCHSVNGSDNKYTLVSALRRRPVPKYQLSRFGNTQNSSWTRVPSLLTCREESQTSHWNYIAAAMLDCNYETLINR